MNSSLAAISISLMTTVIASLSAGRLPKAAMVESAKKPATVVVLYTAVPDDDREHFENLEQVAQFAFDQFAEDADREKLPVPPVKLVAVDDQDNPQHAVEALQHVMAKDKPVAIVGPLYSHVALGIKSFIDKNRVPMVSIFATHNELTRDTQYVFRICASDHHLVKTMAEYLVPEIEKHQLDLTVFKDINDDYSSDLADSFRQDLKGMKINYNEVLFRGSEGIERLRDLNARIWNPTKKDLYFLPTRDIIGGKIIAALESTPYMVATIDTVDFLHLVDRIKSEKTHIRLITTSQWLPQKSDFSKKIEAKFKSKFGRDMTIMSALTFDASYTVADAYARSIKKHIPLVSALKDGTHIHGVTGLILLDQHGERVFSDQFIQEQIIK